MTQTCRHIGHNILWMTFVKNFLDIKEKKWKTCVSRAPLNYRTSVYECYVLPTADKRKVAPDQGRDGGKI